MGPVTSPMIHAALIISAVSFREKEFISLIHDPLAGLPTN